VISFDYDLRNGYVDVNQDQVTVLADAAEKPVDVDIDVARAAAAKASVAM